MTKQNVVVPETITTAATAVAIPNSSSPIFPYPPPRSRPALGCSFRKKHLKLEAIGGETRVYSWVESMRASSPTHARAAVISDEHSAWMKQHPSALSAFEEIVDASRGKDVVVFLDYDGTLSPIVDDPDRAFMSDSMRAAVRDVARCFPTAIVSGRSRDKVYGFVKLSELYYAGSHGMDIKAPVKESRFNRESNIVKFEPPVEFLPMIDEVCNALVEKTKFIPGCKVENSKFCVSVHFRCVDEKSWGALAEQVKAVLMEYPKLHLCQGRKVLEIRPTIKWDKGKALEFLLESLGFGDCKDALPVYIGDDRTDEDAFKLLRRRGQGVGILVSKIPKETSASYSLREPSEVMDFLRGLVEWKRLSLL